jgi:hypothetical protein
MPRDPGALMTTVAKERKLCTGKEICLRGKGAVKYRKERSMPS